MAHGTESCSHETIGGEYVTDEMDPWLNVNVMKRYGIVRE